jgi:hypothetical protein
MQRCYRSTWPVLGVLDAGTAGGGSEREVAPVMGRPRALTGPHRSWPPVTECVHTLGPAAG